MAELILTIENERDQPHVYWIEPWAHDFTMLAGESFLLHVLGTDLNLDVAIHDSERGTQIYLNNSDSFTVTQAGKKLQLGHNREN